MLSFVEKALTNTPILAIFIVFWAGAIASMSSCTLVRIPVVSGYIAGAAGSKKKAILLALSFTMGLIISYTILGILLGIVTNFSGTLIKFSKIIYWFLGTLLVFSGLFLSGLIKWKGMEHRHAIQDKFKNAGYLGGFIFGMIFAFLEMPACPCCSSVLIIIASIVMLKGSFLYSLIIFISFAVGQSFPILLIGTSTGLIKYLLPKMERSEEWIKLVAGNVLIVLGICFIIIA
ncbi:MAG: cytochrome c biogenesis protein CcdA [Candidatus Omnitrophica bacterium]|nr:cytochrome c biogenesis protein CcdA [Candidatus Omnitrophota bacterium]